MSETSFGGVDEGFLLTSEGLGFYYYGHGERRIGHNPFEQIEKDSDRAAGIVAGAIAERRLEDALRSVMAANETEIAKNLFRPSGALGPFSTKIDLAYLLGVISSEAYRDLVIMKGVRNDFAHRLELDSFEIPTIKDRCANFILVDRHVGPVPPRPNISDLPDPPIRADPYRGLPDHIQRLANPRFRYVMTSQILSYRLGIGADAHDRSFPLV